MIYWATEREWRWTADPSRILPRPSLFPPAPHSSPLRWRWACPTRRSFLSWDAEGEDRWSRDTANPQPASILKANHTFVVESLCDLRVAPHKTKLTLKDHYAQINEVNAESLGSAQSRQGKCLESYVGPRAFKSSSFLGRSLEHTCLYLNASSNFEQMPSSLWVI